MQKGMQKINKFVTTKQIVFYDAYSKTVMRNRLTMLCGDNFVNTRLFNEYNFYKIIIETIIL